MMNHIFLLASMMPDIMLPTLMVCLFFTMLFYPERIRKPKMFRIAFLLLFAAIGIYVFRSFATEVGLFTSTKEIDENYPESYLYLLGPVIHFSSLASIWLSFESIRAKPDISNEC